MYFMPVLRAFSECVSPLHHPSSALICSQKSFWNRLPLSAPAVPSCRRRHIPGYRVDTGQPFELNSNGSLESGRPFRRGLFLASTLGPPGWTMSVQLSHSAGNPVMANESDCSPVEPSREDVIVQYIVIRKDMVAGLNWPLGSVISQGCHAAVAAIWLHKDDPVTLQYCAPGNLDNMHKVTLEVKTEAQLRTLSQRLESGGIVHKLWVEQPENYATCLATKPYYKSQVSSFFKKLQLCK